MALVLGDYPEQAMEDVVPAAPMYVAARTAGIPLYEAAAVSAYPPGQQLPETIQERLRYLRFLATYTAAERKKLCRSRPWEYELTPTKRVTAAAVVLGLGWPDASRVRSAIWTEVDGEWQLAPRVLEAAKHAGMTVGAATQFLGARLGELEQHLQSGALTAMHQNDAVQPSLVKISYAELAAAIPRFGWSGRPHARSEQVRTGQDADAPPGVQ